ncbi:MAG TPA: transposase [Terriglobales bacterium]|nr:transposase [Terriglobales bacterium]
MSKPPRDRTYLASRAYFVTAKTWGSRTIFQSERLALLFLETLFHYRDAGKFELHEFVVMPNHAHLLFTPAPDVTLERAMQLIKGGSSHRIGQEVSAKLEVWERGFVDHRIRDEQDFERHREYIRQNPVEAGRCAAPEDFPYSSACPAWRQRLTSAAKAGSGDAA